MCGAVKAVKANHEAFIGNLHFQLVVTASVDPLGRDGASQAGVARESPGASSKQVQH
jgi:hypothetical protein